MRDIVAVLEGAVARRRWAEVLERFERDLHGDDTQIPNDVHGAPRTRVLEAVLQAQCALGRYDDCAHTLRRFETCAVTEATIRKSNVLVDALWRRQRGRRIVGTTYVDDGSARERAGDDVVIYYGSFPYDHRALPYDATIYRHAHFADSVRHEVFESDAPAWGEIGIIYILNLSERRDRYYDTLVELSRIHAPLDRVHHFRVEHETLVPGNPYVNGSACCAKNHAAMMRHFLTTAHDVCLVLEDDVAFASDGRRVCADLATFFARRYAFAVCLLAASKYHDLRAHDDLLLRSYQECTTAAAYIASRASAPLLLECFETGARGIRQTRDVQRFAADRYWASLMVEHPFYTFRRKIAYQKPSWSSIQSRHAYNFD
jgi:GR25 family glycosyltransferase involved in LPS biosynthesis